MRHHTRIRLIVNTVSCGESSAVDAASQAVWGEACQPRPAALTRAAPQELEVVIELKFRYYLRRRFTIHESRLS